MWTSEDCDNASLITHTMPRNGLRPAPKPSKRMLEAAEHSDVPVKAVKRRKIGGTESRRLQPSSEKTGDGRDVVRVEQSSAKNVIEPNTLKSSELSSKAKRKGGHSLPAQRKKTMAKQPIVREAAKVIKESIAVTKKPTAPKAAKAVKERNAIIKQPTVRKPAQPVKKSGIVTEKPMVPNTFEAVKKSNVTSKKPASRKVQAVKERKGRKKTPRPEDVFGILETNSAQHGHTSTSLHINPSIPALEAVPRPSKSFAQTKSRKKPVKKVNIPLLRSLAASRGPQLTPDGKGIDLSPAGLPSPETPHTPYSPDPYRFPPEKHVDILQKNMARGIVVPSYSPFDIVSGGKPPDLSEAEEEFWEDRLGGEWEQEELPDRYGRLWRCVKMVGRDFEENIGWEKGATRGEEGDDVGPGSAVEDFEREVELFLSAFGEELPEWSILDDDGELDFGD